MRRTCLNLPRAVGIAGCLLVFTAGAVPAAALADHRDSTRWWETDGDATSWNGAGGGWNGSGSSQGSTKPAWTPEATRRIDVRNLRVDRGAISPNGDGAADTAEVSFRLRTRSAFVAVRVVDAAGATVRTLGELRELGTTGRFSWNGTTDAGVVVPDGTYRVVLTPITDSTSRADGATPLQLEVVVDTAVPGISTTRPTLAQLRALARRAAELRDAKARWTKAMRSHGNRGWRGRHGNGHGNGNGNRKGWGAYEREWVRLWEARQLRLPVRFTTEEDGEVAVSVRVGSRTRSFETWRAAGRHTVDVVLPKYTAGARATITLASGDDAGNVRRHTVVVRLPAMPRPKPTRRSSDGGDRGSGGGSSVAPVTGVPTSTRGPFPDWLDPIMLRATYGAGVPQSWARSQALANLVFRESSYRPTAQNPTSTAYGLFQFLDQTWATVGCRKTSDAYQQSVCGLRYVQRRYRTPERAWAFWQANHWY